MKKLLFFDIDGTLVGFDGKIPESAMKALELAQKKGHEIFISTGRSRCQIYPEVLDFGFDGIVSATGGYVEYKGKELFHNVFGTENLKALLEYFEDGKASLLFQKKDFCVGTSSSYRIFIEEIARIMDVEPDQIEPFEFLKIDDDFESYPVRHADTESFIYCCCPYTVDELREKLPKEIRVETASYREPEPYSGELTLSKNSKATGIQKILDHLGMTREDVIAFGDSANDLEMMQFAGVSVAMGNATDTVKKNSTLVTDDIQNDGIYNAMKRLDLI